MPLEDFFKREIDRLGKVLTALLTGLRDTSPDIEFDWSEKLTDEVLLKEFNFSLDEFLKLDNSLLLDYLIKDKKLNSILLPEFCQILYELAALSNEEQKTFTLLKKILVIFDYLDKSIDYSYERHQMRQEIESFLKES
jgi:hypothetical protein